MQETNDRKWYGQVEGLIISGEFTRADGFKGPDWSASINTGFASQHRFDCRKKIVPGGWRPVPAEEMDKRYGPGFIALRENLAGVAAALAELSETAASTNEALSARLDVVASRVEALASTPIQPLVQTPVQPLASPETEQAEGRRRRRIE